MKKIIAIICVFYMITASAQNRYQSVLDQIEHNSPAFEVLKQQKNARQAAVQAGAFLSDPEVEFGYFWGVPTEVGHRWDLSVSQEFEFPIVYAHKARIRELQTASAEKDFRQQRMDLLLEAQHLCADLVYYNALVNFHSRCVAHADTMAVLYERRMAAGSCSILEYNRVKMDLAATQNKLNHAVAERDMLAGELAKLNGGTAIAFSEGRYAPMDLPANFTSWCAEAEQKSPALAYLRNEMAIGEKQISLAKSEGLPRFSAGYASENTLGEAFRGAKIGVSIPLWHNKGQVKRAQIEARAMQASFDDAKQRYYSHLQILYAKSSALAGNVSALEKTYGVYNSTDLLVKAFHAGEISLEQYLVQIEFFHDAAVDLLEAQRELEHTVIELYSVQL